MRNFGYIILVLAVCQLMLSCGAKQLAQPKKGQKVVILGNSLVAHAPSLEIGWPHDWGMAASCEECDFVHILKRYIQKENKSNQVVWASIADFERDYDNYDYSKLSFFRDADVLIIKISENIVYKEGMEQHFTVKLQSLIDYLSPSQKTRVIIGEGFWPSPVNKILKTYATQHGLIYVPMEDLFANDKKNVAIGLFENEGVANHPSDFGMQNIADRIWNSINIFFK